MWPKDVDICVMLCSKRSGNLLELFDNISSTAAQPGKIEVLVKIDQTDPECLALLGSESRYPFHLRFFVSQRREGFFSNGEFCNQMLAGASPYAYFVTIINDQNRYIYPGWDNAVRAFRGRLPHDALYLYFWKIDFSLDNPRQLLTEPDDLAFYSRTLLSLMEAIGDRWSIGSWLFAILRHLEVTHGINLGFRLGERDSFYSSCPATSFLDPAMAQGMAEREALITTPESVRLSWARIARNIATYVNNYKEV